MIIFVPFSNACKDIIVTNEMTKGEYNLLMKVRDPSRPGLQVLFIGEKGYEYSYHHPWKNQPWIFKLKHRIIGVATKGDTPPDMIKAGMMMSDAGIAYGDADSPTLYINPTSRAWDDFDWLLYAAENASNEDDAMKRLEEVTKMHAPGVGENLFVVGAKKAYVAEGDAFHFLKREVRGIEVMSNYPRMMWNKRLSHKLISSSFDNVYEGNVKRWQVVRLGGIAGVRITKIGKDWIEVKEIPFGEKVKIEEGEGSKVGNFWVELIESDGRRANIRVCYEYYQWENELKKRLGGIVGVQDLMNISRITSTELNGLRGMAEGESKAAMIFKIPLKNYEKFTMGWFAPDPISAIFIPVHISDYSIYDAYQNGDAAQMSINLMRKFGKIDFSSIERVFLNENDKVEKIALKKIDIAPPLLTYSDNSMQRQAWLIENVLISLDESKIEEFISMWDKSYYNTICNMQKNIGKFDPSTARGISSIALEMCDGRVKIERIANGSDLSYKYRKAVEMHEKGKYGECLKIVHEIFSVTDESLFGIKHSEKEENYVTLLISMSVILLFLLMIYIRKRW